MKRVQLLDLEQLLAELSVENRKIVKDLRKVIAQAAPHVQETILWGGLSYHRPDVGGRVKGAVCQIGFKGDQVRLDFIHGIRLTDALGLLQGKSLSKRYIPIKSVEDTKRPEITAMIREAAALDPSEWI